MTQELFAPQPEAGHRDWYAFEALRTLPRLILMGDKNPYNETYGCFDRSYWHYRTMDFPCGMNQEFVLPLALAYKLPLPHNRYQGSERLRDLAIAGIEFARKASHKDGTTDDYFPFERAMGALVFSLYAMTETCLELEEHRDEFLDFFAMRGDWLLNHNESGKLANHQAFAALALYNVYLLTDDERYRDGSDRYIDLTLSWAKSEGWFQEYEGADPGYHSCTIAFLAKLWQKNQHERIKRALLHAVDFAWYFIHPDGSYAGEYGSRNTYHFYPHGFEVMAPFSEKAAQIADAFLYRGAPNRKRYYNDDDRMAAHYVYDWMQSWRDYHEGARPGPPDLPGKTETAWFPQARMMAVRTPRFHLVVSGAKGGTFKAVAPSGAFAGDTGLIGELEDGTQFTSHLVANNEVRVDREHRRLLVEGRFQRRKYLLPTPWKQLAFRLFMLTVGRFSADLVRRTLQKVLIVQKHPLRMRFRRRIAAEEDHITVVDEIRKPSRLRVRRLSAGPDATSIYVANSNTFQESVLIPWRHFSEQDLEQLNSTNHLVKEWVFRPPPEASQPLDSA